MNIHLALAHVVDSRSDFLRVRMPLVEEEMKAIGWLRDEYHPIESGIICSSQDAFAFRDQVQSSKASSLLIHMPIWGDPIFSINLANQLPLPVMLLGNGRPETSSMVGMLGAGGALNQVGKTHFRVFDHTEEDNRVRIRAFARASAALSELRGQTLGLFGGRALGIFTTMADPAQWQKLFGVDIVYLDQGEIIRMAEALPEEDVCRHLEWLGQRFGGIHFNNSFTQLALQKQVRSYLATRRLAEMHHLHFIGVKCQPELSDGYVCQCVSHLLTNSRLDADGEKDITVHACESDADGALTMQILHLLSGGQAAALMDLRWFNRETGLWTLANCGAIPPSFAATPSDPSGLSAFHMEAHVFGHGGGGAVSGHVPPQKVTLARLCRENGEYWMAIVQGEIVDPLPSEKNLVTPAFPKAVVRSNAGLDFLSVFDSNHIHMVSGNLMEELSSFCRLGGIRCQIW
jgi:L-fucose/D-arabinose isomerase